MASPVLDDRPNHPGATASEVSTVASTTALPRIPTLMPSVPPTPTTAVGSVRGSERSYYGDKHHDDDEKTSISSKGAADAPDLTNDSTSDAVSVTVSATSAPGDTAEASTEVSSSKPPTHGVHDGENTLPRGRRIGLIVIVAFTMAMSGGGQQGLNIALPIIQNELGILESDLQWISSAYSLTSGCFLLLSGRLADVYGRKKCFIIGIGWYAVWCLVGSFMHSGAGLIVTRALAGAGASMGIPSGMGIIAANIHGKQRATAFAIFTAGAPFGGGSGMVLGGVLAAYSSQTWRAVLWIFTGLAALIVGLAVYYVPPDPVKERPAAVPGQKRRAPRSADIDWVGAALVTSGLVLLQFTVSEGMSAPKGWRTPYVPALFTLSMILLPSFFVWEYYVIHHTNKPPLMRLALFTRARGRLGAIYFVGFVAWMGFVSVGYHSTLFYQQVQMTGTIGAMLRFLPAPICGLLCAVVVSRIVHKLPIQLIICIGLTCTGLSGTFMAISGRYQNYWTFPFHAMYLVVIGADFLMPTGSIFVSRLALPEEQSVAAALFQTLIQLGGSFGLTLTSVIATAYTEKGLKAGMDPVDALAKGFKASFWLSASLAYAALLLAAFTLHGIGIVSTVGQDGGAAGKKDEGGVEERGQVEKGEEGEEGVSGGVKE